MKLNKQVGYKELKRFIDNDEDEKESLQKSFCETKTTFAELASEYNSSPAVMRRIILETLGEEGYLIARRRRKELNRKNKKWNTTNVKYGSKKILFHAIKLLQQTSLSYYRISKELGCSRERICQIAQDCQDFGINLNPERMKKREENNFFNHLNNNIRGYRKSE